MSSVDLRARARRNKILGVVHLLLALGIVAGFVIAQSHR
jgi:hypothetical protein